MKRRIVELAGWCFISEIQFEMQAIARSRQNANKRPPDAAAMAASALLPRQMKPRLYLDLQPLISAVRRLRFGMLNSNFMHHFRIRNAWVHEEIQGICCCQGWTVNAVLKLTRRIVFLQLSG
ncbi:uncharacterized protein LOC128921618 [Zeugodacus cucurbitae]|uniref:uncharacterized protein LOC128921618 n=1 Tax=Zeugodacus cucurbitae TaxID=28588 RepID=UPI0023D94E60|nr:uncharacterized protein LOC128921618 [Zeugodacus cucurbitae]